MARALLQCVDSSQMFALFDSRSDDEVEFVSNQVLAVLRLRVLAPNLSLNDLVALAARVHLDAQPIISVDSLLEESKSVVVVEFVVEVK